MADFFQKRNIRAVAVHSDTATSAPRATSLEQLQSGEIDIIFVVDMFNEGVDIPDIDTILMIRPTESSILFMQQLGRGFRKATNKFHLTIIDYIGNHQSFLNKPRSLLGLGLGDRKLVKALDQIQKKTYPLPSNCSITYELKAIDLIKSILDKSLKGELIEAFYHDYKFIYGQRPTAVEALYGGYNPRLTGYGSWFDFTQEMEGLVSEEKQVYQKMSPFLTLLEKLPETQSNKILLLLAMLGENAFPGKLSFDQLERAVSKILERTRSLQVVAGVRNLRENEITRFIHSTIAEWIKIENPHGMAYFTYENGIFGTNFSIETDQLQETFIGLVRELVEWRIMDSLQRIQHLPSSPKSIVCKVLHSKRRPILKLPNREKHPHIPKGKISVEIEGKFYLANFVKIAVNVIEDPKTKKNAITLILRNWFGKNAGLPGTQHRVVFHPSNNGYRLEPLLPDTINT